MLVLQNSLCLFRSVSGLFRTGLYLEELQHLPVTGVNSIYKFNYFASVAIVSELKNDGHVHLKITRVKVF